MFSGTFCSYFLKNLMHIDKHYIHCICYFGTNQLKCVGISCLARCLSRTLRHKISQVQGENELPIQQTRITACDHMLCVLILKILPQSLVGLKFQSSRFRYQRINLQRPTKRPTTAQNTTISAVAEAELAVYNKFCSNTHRQQSVRNI